MMAKLDMFTTTTKYSYLLAGFSCISLFCGVTVLTMFNSRSSFLKSLKSVHTTKTNVNPEVSTA